MTLDDANYKFIVIDILRSYEKDGDGGIFFNYNVHNRI